MFIMSILDGTTKCMANVKVFVITLYSCSYVPIMYISSLYKQESKPLGSIPLAENKVIRHPDDPKLPNQYRFEIISKLCLRYYMLT